MSRYVKSLEEFLNLDYKMVITPFEDEGEKGFVVSCPEISGLEVFGETLEEAIEEVREAKIALYEVFLEKGINIRYPEEYNFEDEDFSGRMTLRIPKTLHKRIKYYSEDNNVSLNTGIIQLINDGINYADIKDMKGKIYNSLNKFNKKIILKVEYSMNDREGEYYNPSFKRSKSNYSVPKFHFEENPFALRQ
ncbi:type II toxin-antitoxin system HicB family antitoxin [Salinibacillus xinjiangensis]|uniref:Toxin-antitoxin system HicB family antitoxin n=1 Tax=Salinibacillus xinjiangensis TaxID=1229268 RepID=A0A6G1X707_9BACI|nr:toxin-antitoxin system HicB family antitoxin [Salinibacillus xinjiangensis]MRG86727.1 toxin-antitoxin system HicB family antitoxin [Salinibacillus xinjiangensis]